jgi:hypothetical protein
MSLDIDPIIIFRAGMLPRALKPLTKMKLPIKPNGTESNTANGRM